MNFKKEKNHNFNSQIITTVSSWKIQNKIPPQKINNSSLSCLQFMAAQRKFQAFMLLLLQAKNYKRFNSPVN